MASSSTSHVAVAEMAAIDSVDQLNQALNQLPNQINPPSSIDHRHHSFIIHRLLEYVSLPTFNLAYFLDRQLPKIQLAILRQLPLDPPTSDLVRFWFGLRSSSLESLDRPNTNRFITHLSKVAIHSFHHILPSLSSASSSTTKATNFNQSIHSVLDLLDSILNSYQLSDWYQIILDPTPTLESNPHSPDHLFIDRWKTFVNHLIGLSAKTSGLIYQLTQSSVDSKSDTQYDLLYHQFHTRPFLARTSLQFYSLVNSLSSKDPITDPISIKSSVILLNKLVNLGFTSLDLSSKEPGEPFDFLSSIWPQFILSVLQSNNYPHLPNLWVAIISSLPREELKSFIASLLAHLQSRLTFRDHDHQFSTNAQALAVERAGAELLKFYLGSWGSENQIGSTDISEIVTEIVTTADSWSIGIARQLSRWIILSVDDDQNSLIARAKFSRTMLGVFGSHHQISHGSTSQQAFLLVLLLLTACPFQSDRARSAIDVSLDRVFVASIQRSLGSLRSQFRLLGMLMAELMTEFNRLPETTKLDFGHDYEAFEDYENRLCVAIRKLSNHWSQSILSNDPSWHQVLSSSATQHSQALDQYKIKQFALPSCDQLPQQSGSSHDAPSLIDAQPNIQSNLSCLSSKHEPIEPYDLGLQELCLNPKRARPSPKKPKIEILNSTSFSDPSELESYDIPEEDLQSLYPNDGNDTGAGKTKVVPFSESEGLDFDQLKRKKDAKPIYLSELSDFLKDSDNFDRVRIGLMEAENLIRQKRNWGTDLSEHAINLTFALLNLQDHFDLEGFETSRQCALVSLVVTNPSTVGSCLIEQLFYHQYTITQRVSMLNALIIGLLELADPRKSKNQNQHEDENSSNKSGFKQIPSPSIHQALMNHQSYPYQFDGSSRRLIHETPPRSSLDMVYERTPQNPKPTWISKKLQTQKKSSEEDRFMISGILVNTASTLETSLVNRLNWYLDQFNDRVSSELLITSTATPTDTNSRVFKSGSGWMILFEPLVSLRVIETLRALSFIIITYSAEGGRHSRHFLGCIKEVVCILVKIIKFLVSNHEGIHGRSSFKAVGSKARGSKAQEVVESGNDFDGNHQEGINDELIIKLSLEVIVTLLLLISPQASSSKGNGDEATGGDRGQLNSMDEMVTINRVDLHSSKGSYLFHRKQSCLDRLLLELFSLLNLNVPDILSDPSNRFSLEFPLPSLLHLEPVFLLILDILDLI